MNRISLDFSPRPRHRFTVVATLAALLTAGVILARQHAAEAELQDWQRKWQTQSERSARQGSKGDGHVKLGLEIARANRVIEKLGTPWGEVVTAIDATIVDDVTLLSVEPDAERHEIRISAEAKNRSAMLNYIRALQRSATFRDGHVVSDQINLQDPQRPVRFTALAGWARGTKLDAQSESGPP